MGTSGCSRFLHPSQSALCCYHWDSLLIAKTHFSPSVERLVVMYACVWCQIAVSPPCHAVLKYSLSVEIICEHHVLHSFHRGLLLLDFITQVRPEGTVPGTAHAVLHILLQPTTIAYHAAQKHVCVQLALSLESPTHRIIDAVLVHHFCPTSDGICPHSCLS